MAVVEAVVREDYLYHHSYRIIKYILVQGKGIPITTIPKLTQPLFPYEDPGVTSYHYISEVARVFDMGFHVNNVNGTSLILTYPSLSDSYVFVVLPLALDSDENTLIRYIYAIIVDENSSIDKYQIESHLRKLDHSLPPFQSILHKNYTLILHRRGPNSCFILPNSNEYSAGAIFFLQETTIDDDSNEYMEEGIAATRDGVILLRDEPSNHELRCVGSQVVAILPQATRINIQEDYHSDNENLQLVSHKRPITHENTVTDSGTGNEQEPTNEEELEETLAGVQVEGQVDKEPTTLILDKERSLILCPPVQPIKEQQEEPIPSQTTLSTIKSGQSYPYLSPIPATDEQQFQPSTSHSSTPTMSPLAAEVRNTQQLHEYEELPNSISNSPHGTILCARSVLLKLIPSGRFANLPIYKDLRNYTQLGKGRNGKVYKYIIAENFVALKYTKYRKNEVNICCQLFNNNIVPVLGVIVVDGIAEKMCCQIMPLMTCSLRTEICPIGGGILNALKCNLSEDILRRNLSIIYCSILKGLVYLSENNLEIQDLKDSNILVYRTCNCDSVYLCDCSCGYSVELSDFDSICMSKGIPYKECDVHKKERKSSVLCAKVLGTPGYRAPEKFDDHCNCEGVAITGPWSDMWSFGVFLINQLLGLNSEEKCDTIKEANIVSGVDADCHVLDTQSELFSPFLKLLKLNDLKPCFKLTGDVAQLASQCIKADCSQRATPKQLLRDPFFADIPNDVLFT